MYEGNLFTAANLIFLQMFAAADHPDLGRVPELPEWDVLLRRKRPKPFAVRPSRREAEPEDVPEAEVRHQCDHC